jgi:integrase
MPKVNNMKTEVLSPTQLKAFLRVLDESTDIQASNLMKLALYTGLRRSELFRLKWDHIDFAKGFITVFEPKGGKNQIIPLNRDARKILDNHPRSESEYVFPGRFGEQRDNITKAVNKIKKAAELPDDFRPLHGLRHVYASMLASSGQVDMYTLQKLLTHKSPQMTQRYAHLTDDALKRASNLMGGLVEQTIKNAVEKKEAESA